MSVVERLIGVTYNNRGEVLTKVSDLTWVSTSGDVINQVIDDVSVLFVGTAYTPARVKVVVA